MGQLADDGDTSEIEIVARRNIQPLHVSITLFKSVALSKIRRCGLK
jgi:hypothetical protein